MYDLLPDVKLSIELEEKGYDFYKLTAAKTGNPLAAATLASLADRELEHIKRINEFYASLTGGKPVDAKWLIAVETPPEKRELLQPILQKLKTSLDKKFTSTADIDEAYKIAEDLETESYELYDKIAGKADNEYAKKFYTALAQEEREHYAILDETLQYLKTPGDWFKLQERWIVEGG